MKLFYSFLLTVCFLVPVIAQTHPAQPVPMQEMTAEKWQTDLRFMANQLERVHKNAFHKISRDEFYREVKKLDARIPSMENHQIAAEFMRIVARVGDGHTGVRWGAIAASGVFPVIFYIYEDGMFVQRAASEYADIVGGKVVKVNETPIDEAVEKIKAYIWRDNEMGVKSTAPWYLTSPQILHAAGLSTSKETATFTILKNGREIKVALKPSAKLDDIGSPPVAWLDARRSEVDVPAWQKDQRNNFRFEMLGDSKTLYVQFNAVQNKSDETVEAFFNRVFEYAEKNPVERLVLDLRLNGGGNNYLNLPLTTGSIKSRMNVPGKFFVIIGRETFSAAQNTVNELEKYTKAVFVGEPTGASPNHYGDAQNIVLPNSRIAMRASTLWWQDADPRDVRKWKAPDVAADLTSEHYRDGRDPAMEAILSYRPAQSLEGIIAEQRVKQDVPVFVKKVREFKANPAHKYAETERRINDIGYFLMERNQFDDAVEVFKLNAEMYPRSANVYDSLGDAYLKKGDKTNALANYKKALEIDPSTRTAADAVRNLSQE